MLKASEDIEEEEEEQLLPRTSAVAGTVFSLLLFYWTTMGPRTLVSPGERRGR